MSHIVHLSLRNLAAALIISLFCSFPVSAQSIGVETEAREAFMVDATTGYVMLAKDADKLMPPSSMSKMMTAHMVFEKLRKGELRMEDELPVSENAWRKGGSASGGSTMFLPLGGRATVKELIQGIVVQSGNDACIVIAEAIGGSEEKFAEMMTKEARAIGLQRSTFKNATGLPDPEHMVTARELAMLAKHTIETYPEYYPFYSELNFTYNNVRQGNRNPLLYKNIGADGLKTGHTEAAGYGLTASVKRGDRRLILVVNGLKSMNQRAKESERLIEWGFREFDNVALFKKNDKVEDVEVWLGEQLRVPVIAEKDIAVTLPRSGRRDLKAAIVYDGPVAAPIKKGTPLATLTITGQSLSQPIEVPLVAAQDVERLGPLGRIAAATSHLLFGRK